MESLSTVKIVFRDGTQLCLTVGGDCHDGGSFPIEATRPVLDRAEVRTRLPKPIRGRRLIPLTRRHTGHAGLRFSVDSTRLIG
jgi:hypothetical protein